MRPTGYSKTSVLIYYHTLRNNPEERRSYLLLSGSIHSRIRKFAQNTIGAKMEKIPGILAQNYCADNNG
jgi:GrpB-like predicted nucleotidyltransferase (UPF0157 family)